MNAKPAKAKGIVDLIKETKYVPSKRNWEELLIRANGDNKLAMHIGKSWLFWAKERRNL